MELLEDALAREALVRDRVRQAMEARRISQREMDRRLGYAEGLVSRLLAGSRPFQVYELIAIAEILAISPHELFLDSPAGEERRPFPIPEDQWTALVESTLRKLGYDREESVKPPAAENEPAHKQRR